MPKETWDGASCAMGNSTKQWKASYNPSHKRREIQGAIIAHSSFASQVLVGSSLAYSSQLPPSSSPLVEARGSRDLEVEEKRMPFQTHPIPPHGQVMATFISPKSGRKRKGHASNDVAGWGEEWGHW